MVGLNLSAIKSQAMASSFPEPADIYVCDKCGIDITNHFIAQQSHSWRPLGQERYTCQCGERYLTGAVEWIHLSAWERRRRLSQTVGLGILCSAMASPLGLLAYFLLRILHLPGKVGLIGAIAITACPFALWMISFWFEVMASMWRTKRPE